MGDRGGTATYGTVYQYWDNYTRWEIGGEPQLQRINRALRAYYTRWEIGGEPQLVPMRDSSGLYYTRWEIGGEPQRYVGKAEHALIIPDGRSGGNRNRS